MKCTICSLPELKYAHIFTPSIHFTKFIKNFRTAEMSDRLYRKRIAMIEYLNSTFQNATFRLPIEKWMTPLKIQHGGRFDILDGYLALNSLFTIEISHNTRDGDYTLDIQYSLTNSPSMILRPFVGETNRSFKLTQDGDDLIWETKSMVPLRYLYVLKELEEPCKDAVIELKEIPNFSPVIYSLPDFTIDAIIDKIDNSQEEFKVVSAPGKTLWQTMNTGVFEKGKRGWSPEALAVANETERFECLGKSSYYPLPASEGGIYVENPYSRAWSHFIRSMGRGHGSVRLECKGSCVYRSNTDVSREELVLMSMIFKKLGCEIVFRFDKDD